MSKICTSADHNYCHTPSLQSNGEYCEFFLKEYFLLGETIKILTCSLFFADQQVFNFSAPLQQVQQKKSHCAPLPRIPRVPIRERTPLMQSVISAAVHCRARAQRLQTHLKQKNAQIRKMKREAEEIVMQKIKERLDPSFYKILENNLQNSGRKPRGRRYPLDVKIILFGLRKKGPRCFNALPFIKPSRQTLRKVTTALNFKPGQNDILLKALSARVEHMNDKEKQVTIIFDEMSLRVYFVYDSVLDKVIGFVDFGNGRRQHQPAEEAFNVMVRSIYGQWKQPIAFYFTHRKCTAEDFQLIINESIRAVLSTGLVVRATCTDSMQKNKTAMDLLGASSEQPWFFLEQQKVYTVYDPPHNLKSLRNAQMKYDMVQADGTVVRKSYVDQVVRMDMKTQPRLLKKISERHLTPNNFEKMSVPLASQLYSRKVAATITTYTTLGALPPEAMVTARFFELINNFFDSFNGVQESAPDEFHKYLCAVSPQTGHFELWIKMYTEIQEWQFIGSKNLKFPERMLMTMRATANLVTDLTNEGHGPVPVGHINSDCIENCHCCLRGELGHCSNPSAQEYPAAFCTCVVNFMTRRVKGKNCRDDNALNLIGLSTLIEIADTEAKAKKSQLATATVGELIFDLPVVETEVVEIDESEEDADDPDDEEEETEVLPPLSADEDFLQRLRAKMAAAQSVEIASPVINAYLKKMENCDGCTKILLGDTQFPLHILHTLSAATPTFSSQLPSASICTLITLIYKKMEFNSPTILHQDHIIENFVTDLESLPSVQSFQLCDRHEEHKRPLLKRISIGALQDVLLALNQNYKEKKKQRKDKKNQKEQRVQHT